MKISHELKCNLCFSQATKSTLFSSCGHFVCESCVNSMDFDSHSCPFCGSGCDFISLSQFHRYHGNIYLDHLSSLCGELESEKKHLKRENTTLSHRLASLESKIKRLESERPRFKPQYQQRSSPSVLHKHRREYTGYRHEHFKPNLSFGKTDFKKPQVPIKSPRLPSRPIGLPKFRMHSQSPRSEPGPRSMDYIFQGGVSSSSVKSPKIGSLSGTSDKFKMLQNHIISPSISKEE